MPGVRTNDPFRHGFIPPFVVTRSSQIYFIYGRFSPCGVNWLTLAPLFGSYNLHPLRIAR
jgi:hypothetical protein